ncbi:MAG: response regulator [Ignavibacteria bacterium]|jgi:CheY-like chemotaxis protein
MLHGTNLEAIEKINDITRKAIKGSDNFPNEICNFLVSEFEFLAIVLFRIDNNDLIVLGKSNSAKKHYMQGAKFKCSTCRLLNNDTNQFGVNSDTNCELQISEYVVYETCVKFKINNETNGFLKIANKSTFAQRDSEALKKISDFLNTVMELWSNARDGNLVISETPFHTVVSDIASELRTPTNSIIGFTSILAEDNLTSSQSEYVNTIKRNSQSLLMTINDLSELAKIEGGKISFEKREVNLKSLVQEIAQIFKNKNDNNKIEYKVNIGSQFPNSITIDDLKIRYVLNNLITVLTKLTKKGTISFNLNAYKNKIEIIIDSNGKSIPFEVQNKFFDPFTISKIDEIKDSNITGLSITLVKKYIEALNGSIFIDQSTKKGTVVKITLAADTSIVNNGASTIEEVKTQIPQPTIENNKILVVEDDFATSKLLSNYLNKWGYEPTIVNTEEQTMRLLGKEQFLAVILDIELPHINGLELLKKIHDNPRSKNIPVIVCAVEIEEQKAFMMGAVEYFVKPINYNYLVEVLTSYKLRKNSTVLCVDDDLPTLNLVKQAIETAGFNALAENYSKNVMSLIKNKEIDLAIIDLDMPDINGFELIQLIKSEQRFAKLPIIIYTGKENYREDLMKVDGMFEYLLDKRSTNFEDLQETISAMINRYETPTPVEEVEEKSSEIKILLAEDYKHSQIIVTRLLKKNGFTNVVVVENGEEAYNLVKKENFNLILMDMQMPIMNGFEATEKIRQLPEYKDTPIIALTAFAMKGDREKCLDAGATDYIPKPIDSKEFIEKVKYYVNQ